MPSQSRFFADILESRFNRRGLLSGAAKLISAGTFAAGIRAGQPDAASSASSQSDNSAAKDFRLQFEPIATSRVDFVTIAAGYRVGLLIKWGDPLFMDSPAHDPMSQSAAAQAKQFGYNNDWMGYFPLPAYDVANPRQGLMVCNHEYTNPELMFKNYAGIGAQTREQTDIEMAAHGLTVVEIARNTRGDEWYYIQGSRYNRRITATTEFVVTGPAAGSEWLRTSADPTGTRVIGTLNNCSGGQTPWGTVLSGEENFQGYFANRDGLAAGPVKTSHTRYGISTGAAGYAWSRHLDRFDVTKEPNEPFRFGWVVEFDPYNPESVPKKRTAIGRFRHEACTVQVARNGRVVAYSGDDERYEFTYKFVSNGKYNPFDGQANDQLLDNGVLYVAKFNDDGTGVWLPLVQGEGPLTAANGFRTQADVLVNARFAGTALGATRMDRPEDVETNPVNGKVYIALTNNDRRTDQERDKANPRSVNRWGHIIELTEDGGDHTSTRFTWEIFMLCGDGNVEAHGAFFAGYDPKKVSSIAAPDNITFDSKGNLWISTDGQGGGLSGINDSICAVPTDGPERGFNRRLMNTVIGSETSSLVFNSDDTALFVGIQHPGEGGKWTDNAAESVSTFPTGSAPCRPAILVVSKAEGNPVVGS
jgi:secreted PhoX family phosphatase